MCEVDMYPSLSNKTLNKSHNSEKEQFLYVKKYVFVSIDVLKTSLFVKGNSHLHQSVSKIRT